MIKWLAQRLFRGPEMPRGIVVWDSVAGAWEGREVANDGRLVWKGQNLLDVQKFMEDAGFNLEWGDAPAQP